MSTAARSKSRAVVAAATASLSGTGSACASVTRSPASVVAVQQRGLRPDDSLRALMGPSRQIQEIDHAVRQVAASPFTVLIQGETGTGKELVARAIYRLSGRSGKAFIALDCGAIPETLMESELFGYEKGAFTGAWQRKQGHFQLAEGGTLFLDEIGNLPLPTQSKLLRALEERQVHALGAKGSTGVDIRIITASNATLERETAAGRFRRDLYYRLSEFTITLPPLRERLEDILYLADRFRIEANREVRRAVRGISAKAVRLLLRYPWPGNVRELRNVVRQAVLLSADVIRPEHLPRLSAAVKVPPSDSSPASVPVPESPCQAARAESEDAAPGPNGRYDLRRWRKTALDELEREFIRGALHDHSGNVSRTAEALGVHRSTLQRVLRRHGLAGG